MGNQIKLDRRWLKTARKLVYARANEHWRKRTGLANSLPCTVDDRRQATSELIAEGLLLPETDPIFLFQQIELLQKEAIGMGKKRNSRPRHPSKDNNGSQTSEVLVINASSLPFESSAVEERAPQPDPFETSEVESFERRGFFIDPDFESKLIAKLKEIGPDQRREFRFKSEEHYKWAKNIVRHFATDNGWSKIVNHKQFGYYERNSPATLTMRLYRRKV